MFLHADAPSCTGITGTPEGVLPCVWMSAGLIAFKLCDREGECESCPFDRAMRGLGPLPEALRPGASPASARGRARRRRTVSAKNPPSEAR